MTAVEPTCGLTALNVLSMRQCKVSNPMQRARDRCRAARHSDLMYCMFSNISHCLLYRHDFCVPPLL